MTVSNIAIIIPSLNSPIIDQIVATILVQDGVRFVDDIVIVGKDDLGLLADQHSSLVTFIDTKTAVPPATARNMGIKATTSDFLIFLDSDCIPQANWLCEHMAAHQAGHPVVGGGVIPDGENYWSLSYNLTMFHEYFSTAIPGERSFLPTLNLSIERNVINVVGLLDEALPRSQDLDWTTRMKEAGFQPYFWPKTAVQHRHNRTTFSKLWQDCVRSGHFARKARLSHQDALHTPAWLHSRLLVLLLSPFVAASVTLKILRKQPRIMRQQRTTIPAIYMSKLAWCWGASRASISI